METQTLTSPFKPALIRMFLAGEILIENEIGGRQVLQALLSEAIPECNTSSEFASRFYGYDVRRNDWYAITTESDTSEPTFAAVKLSDFINSEPKKQESCQGTCEVCTCLDMKKTKSRNKIVSFKASFSHDSKDLTSFCATVIKGKEKGSWSRLVWFPRAYCTLKHDLKSNEWIISAPVWLLAEKGILFSITLTDEYHETP